MLILVLFNSFNQKGKAIAFLITHKKMRKLPKVSVIVLNYNGKETIKSCLESVYKSDYENHELIVVDNASKDGSFELAKKLFSRSHFILNSENIGFAAGNNVAIRFALEKMSDYVFLLNNDALLEVDTLSKLVLVAEKQGLNIISPLIKGSAGKIWFAGGKINWLKMRSAHIFSPQRKSFYTTRYASGCAMLVKKEVFREIGLFDEKYFLYYEDADFCLRAAKKGFKIGVNPQAVVYHFEKSESNPENKNYWLALSGLIFFKTHTPLLLKPWIKFYFFLRKIKNWRDVKFKKDGVSLAVQQAYKDYKKSRI